MLPTCSHAAKTGGASDPAAQGSAHTMGITRIRTRCPLTSFLSLGLHHSASSIVLRLGFLVAGLHGFLLSSAPAGEGRYRSTNQILFQGGFWAAENLATTTRIVVMRLIRRCSLRSRASGGLRPGTWTRSSTDDGQYRGAHPRGAVGGAGAALLRALTKA